MQEICAEAGISPGALYRYFSSKSDIIAAIAEDDRREMDAIMSGVWTGGGFVERLCSFAARTIGRFAEEAAGPIFVDVFAEAARDPLLAARLNEIDQAGLARMSEAIAQAQRRGEVDPGLDPYSAARTLFSAIEGLALRNALTPASDTEGYVKEFRALAERYLAVQS